MSVQKFDTGFSGSVETLAFQLNRVRFVRLDKGADYAVHGPDDGELGAAWRKSGDYGDYLSVKLDLKASVPPPRHVPAAAEIRR